MAIVCRRFGRLSTYSRLSAGSSSCSCFGSRGGGAGVERLRSHTLDGHRLYSSPGSLGGMTFSEEQWDAVTAPLDVPVRIVAGPGSGKTRVLAGRIHYVLQMNPEDASRIVALTFTNKAAEEMKQRVGMEGVVFGTFHSFCYRQLKKYSAHVMDVVFPGRDVDWMVMDQDDCRRLMEKVVKDAEHDMDVALARSVLSKIKRLKNSVGYLDPSVGYEAYIKGDENLLFWTMAYEKALRDAGALDFEDLLGVFEHVLKTKDEVAMGLRNKFKYILVDEFQDANVVQYNIIKHLCRGNDDAKHVFVVGDVDQTIYTWRGASADHMRDMFLKDFPHSVCYRLKDNYRSTKDILGVAQSLISTLQNSDRVDEFRAVRKDGHGMPVDVFVYSNPVEEGMGIAQDIKSRLGEHDDCRIAVLLRTHASARFIETALASAQVPYTVVGGVSFWKRSEIRDIMAYLKLALNVSDVLSLERVINTPKRGIGPAAIKGLSTAAEGQGINVAEYVFGALNEEDVTSKSVRKSLSGFRDLISSIREKLEHNEPLHDVLNYIVDNTGYREYILGVKEEDSKKQVRLSNIDQLIDMSHNAVEEDISDGNSVLIAKAFVDAAAMYGDEDAPGNAPVQVMTMHAAKGLEFNRVYIPFVTEGLIPCVVQQDSSMDPWEQMDEETRLMFVSITRAKDSLCVSYNKDARHGRSNKPSRFLSLMFAKERPRLVDFTVN